MSVATAPEIVEAPAPMPADEPRRFRRSMSLAIAYLSGGTGLTLLLGVAPEGLAVVLASIVSVISVLGIGALFITNGWGYGGRDRLAWAGVGGGALCFAVGEILFRFPAVASSGVADVFYLLGYPVVGAGILLLPYISGRRWERVRLVIDSAAGAVSIAAISWVAVIGDLWAQSDRAGGLIVLLYPLGDVALLIAVLIMATRRSAYQFDGRLVTLALSMVILVTGNLTYAFQIEAGTYRTGGPLDGFWLIGYALGALTTFLLSRPAAHREVADRPEQWWSMLAPYTAVIVLFTVTAAEFESRPSLLQATTAIVGVLIIVRQTVAIRENREVVEKQRTDLVAAISHELRTPLAAIGGFVEIMADDPDIGRDDRVEMIDMVRDQTRHLTRIVEDMIELSRDKLSAARIDHRPVDVADLIESSLDLIPDLTLHVTREVEDGLVMTGDESRLRQILVNYLVNASRYGGGSICIVAARKGGEVLLEVHDNGPGVPKKYEITIWDRFERGANTYISTVQGSGLGLAIVRQLAEAHGGTAGYRRSETLGGSCFWVSIPVR